MLDEIQSRKADHLRMAAGAEGGRVNAILARSAERFEIAMGVGSQRAALVDPSTAVSYTVVREEAPSAFLLANVGAPQLVDQRGVASLTVTEVAGLVAAIRADALAVHLNPLQELVQTEGERNARGQLAAISELAAGL